MLAAEGGHTDTMQALAALGTDIHIQDEVSPRVQVHSVPTLHFLC